MGEILEPTQTTEDSGAEIGTEQTLEKFGLDAKRIIEAWKISVPEEDYEKIVDFNSHWLELLEEQVPGSTKVLNQEFGICDFARYPLDLLRDQYVERDNADKPYGIILYPRADHNGGYYGSIKALEKLHKQLGEQFLVRVIECKNKYEIARRLIALNKRYGKISFAIVGGHGTSETIEFSEGEDRVSCLHSEDLKTRGVARASQFFIENPTIILASCATGQEGGIGQSLSEAFSCRVIAPDKPAHFESIDVNVEDDKLEFDVEYSEDSEKEYLSGKIIK